MTTNTDVWKHAEMELKALVAAKEAEAVAERIRSRRTLYTPPVEENQLRRSADFLEQLIDFVESHKQDIDDLSDCLKDFLPMRHVAGQIACCHLKGTLFMLNWSEEGISLLRSIVDEVRGGLEDS